MKRIITSFACAFACAFATWHAQAQLPTLRLNSIHPAGARINTTVDITVAGGDLDEANELLFSHPGITAKHKEGTQFSISVSREVPPGTYEARLRGHFGISNPRSFVVGQLDQKLEQGNPHTVATASPAAVESVIFGRADANAIDHFKFQTKAGQRILIECLDKAIDSKMDGSLAVLDPSGKEIARSRSGGLLEFTANSEGEHIVQVYDFTYGGGSDYFYRLSLSTIAHIDFIIPPTGIPGTKSRYTLYGRNLPAGQPVSDMTINGHSLQKLIVEIELPSDPTQFRPRTVLRNPYQSALSGFEYRLPVARGVSNPVFIGFATAPVVLEDQSNDQPDLAQQITLPCEYVGQFWPARDQDWVTFKAKKGDTYIIELFSHRLGTASNPFALLQKVKRADDGTVTTSDVKEIAASDANVGGNRFKTVTRDPAWRFAVKEDGEYRIQVLDLFNQAENRPDQVYRLAIRKENPDFRLFALSQSESKDKKKLYSEGIVARRGQTIPVRVLALRQDGFNGPIEVSASDLPPGVTCTSATLPNKATSGTLLLTVAPDAAPWSGPLQFTGKAKIQDKDVVRPAISAGVTWNVNDAANEHVHARLTDHLAAAVCNEPTPISLHPGTSLETSVAGKIKVPLKVIRNAAFNAKFKIKPTGHGSLAKAKEIEIDGKAETAEYELDLAAAKLGVGTYQLYFQTETKGKYRNNPDAVNKANAEAKAANDALEVLKKEAAAAEEEKKKSEAAAKTAAEEAKKAEATLTAAEEARKKSDAAANAAAEEATKAQAAFAAAEKAMKAAQQKATESAAKRTEAVKATETAKVTRDKSVSSKAAAEEATKQAVSKATELAAKVKPAETAKAEADKVAKATNDKSKPRDLTIPVYSAPFTVKVTPAPITLPADPASTKLTPGTKVTFPVSITRLYGFKDPVELSLIIPKEVKGITSAKVTIEKDKNETTLTLEASKDSKPGDQTVTLEAKLKLNGQELKVSRPITVTVTKAPEEAAQAEKTTKQ